MKKLPPQKRLLAEPRQVLYGSISGGQQTPPRAELTAIEKGLQYGVSPQVIVCDHKNHVEALESFARGFTSMLNPKTPNVDLWRRVVDIIQSRGGMCKEGPDQLWAQWQPAHLRARSDETMLDRNLRRGNDTVDYYANEGRKLHSDIANKVHRVRYLAHVAKTWARWIGKAAALQHDSEFQGCDHDLKPTQHKSGGKSKKLTANIPYEARILRKFPWGIRSLGSAEYRDDLHDQAPVPSDPNADNRVLDMARTARAAASRTMVGARYLDHFDAGQSQNQPRIWGRRVFTKAVNEYHEPLSQDDALGHRLFIAGLFPNQYIWCEACNSYTGVRAQKLLRKCTRIRHPSRAISRLKDGNHPDMGTPLTTLPRRVTRRDVGSDVWVGSNGQVPYPDCIPDTDATVVDGSLQASLHCDTGACLDIDIHPSSIRLFSDCYEEEDPLDLGFCLG